MALLICLPLTINMLHFPFTKVVHPQTEQMLRPFHIPPDDANTTTMIDFKNCPASTRIGNNATASTQDDPVSDCEHAVKLLLVMSVITYVFEAIVAGLLVGWQHREGWKKSELGHPLTKLLYYLLVSMIGIGYLWLSILLLPIGAVSLVALLGYVIYRTCILREGHVTPV